MHPHSPKKHLQEYLEDGFVRDFDVMYSKNNNDRHPLRREYFDNPVNYIHKGFIFSPRNKLPLDLYDNGGSHYNVKLAQSPRFPSQISSKSNSIFEGNFRTSAGMTTARESPVTTGMPDSLLFNEEYVKPKPLAKVAGKLSNDYGVIPQLRSPFKPNKKFQFKRKTGMKKYANSIVATTDRGIMI